MCAKANTPDTAVSWSVVECSEVYGTSDRHISSEHKKTHHDAAPPAPHMTCTTSTTRPQSNIPTSVHITSEFSTGMHSSCPTPDMLSQSQREPICSNSSPKGRMFSGRKDCFPNICMAVLCMPCGQIEDRVVWSI